MGTWGAGIFSNDTAADVRDEYRSLIADGVDASEATNQLISAWGQSPASDEVDPDFWLALAATQSRLGRLEDQVKIRALSIIDSGSDLERWRVDAPELVRSRRASTSKLRERLVGPQPSARKPRVYASIVPQFAPGEIVAYKLADDRSLLFRIVGHAVTNQRDTADIMELVDWIGIDLPDVASIEAMPARPRTDGGRYWAPLAIGKSVREHLSVVGRFEPPNPPQRKTRRFGLTRIAESGWHLAHAIYLRWDDVPDRALAALTEESDRGSRQS